MELTFALLWTFCLICDIMAAVTGGTASWILVFCPLVVLVVDKWLDYFSR